MASLFILLLDGLVEKEEREVCCGASDGGEGGEEEEAKINRDFLSAIDLAIAIIFDPWTIYTSSVCQRLWSRSIVSCPKLQRSERSRTKVSSTRTKQYFGMWTT